MKIIENHIQRHIAGTYLAMISYNAAVSGRVKYLFAFLSLVSEHLHQGTG